MRKLSRYKRFLGLPLVYAGVVELFLCYVFNLTRFFRREPLETFHELRRFDRRRHSEIFRRVVRFPMPIRDELLRYALKLGDRRRRVGI